MQDEAERVGQNAFLMIGGPEDHLAIPRASNKSWLTLFYALPKELVEKQKEYLSIPRCPYEVLRTEKYDDLINDDLFLQLVWDCYAWSIWQCFEVPKQDGTYRDIPGLDLHYSGDFPLWRLSYYAAGLMREKYEHIGMGFQELYNLKPGQEIRYLTYQEWSNLIRNLMDQIIEEQNWQPMIDDIWRNRTPEDYSEFYSKVKAGFEAQWSHSRTTVGRKMRSLEEMAESAETEASAFAIADENDYAEEAVNRITGESFLTTLSDRDRQILTLKKEGYTDQEIAEKVGYKTHSAVVKRMQKISALFEEFTKDEYDAYRKSFEE